MNCTTLLPPDPIRSSRTRRTSSRTAVASRFRTAVASRFPQSLPQSLPAVAAHPGEIYNSRGRAPAPAKSTSRGHRGNISGVLLRPPLRRVMHRLQALPQSAHHERHCSTGAPTANPTAHCESHGCTYQCSHRCTHRCSYGGSYGGSYCCPHFCTNGEPHPNRLLHPLMRRPRHRLLRPPPLPLPPPRTLIAHCSSATAVL